jgi:hypothetical protein
MMISDETRKEGFEIFKKGLVRRLSPTHFVAKTQLADSWQLIELKDGRWVCDCKLSNASCVHIYAALLQRSTARLQPDSNDQTSLKCRHCSSPDIRGCGYRFNSGGIMKRYFCNECHRKFSLRFVEKSSEHFELGWLLNEIGMLTAKLTELLSDMNARIEILTTVPINQELHTDDTIKKDQN